MSSDDPLADTFDFTAAVADELERRLEPRLRAIEATLSGIVDSLRGFGERITRLECRQLDTLTPPPETFQD